MKCYIELEPKKKKKKKKKKKLIKKNFFFIYFFLSLYRLEEEKDVLNTEEDA